MANLSSLFLHEEVMLLALRDEEGTIASGTMYQYAIGAAILAELLVPSAQIKLGREGQEISNSMIAWAEIFRLP